MNAVVGLPRIDVAVEGTPLAAEDARTLGAIRVQQRLSLPTLCELTFLDPEGPLAGAASMTPGAALRISVEGYDEPLFVGQVTAVDYDYGSAQGRQVHVRGYDLLHQLRKRQPVGTHVQVTVAELARTLASDLGLSVEAATDGPVHQQLVQYRQSDFDLMRELAAHEGIYTVVPPQASAMCIVRYDLPLGDIAEVWRRGSICENYADIEAAVYAVGGWADGYSNAVFRLLELDPGR